MGVGTKERHYIKDYSRIVKKIGSILDIADKNVFYYGSSAGGFMSILLAIQHKFTTAIVNNPQTKINKYRERHKGLLYKAVFPELSEEEILNKYPERMSIAEAIKLNEYVPRVYYLRNALYDFDIDNHYNPFLKK